MMVCGIIVGYVFFGNLALDQYGRKTIVTNILNIVIPMSLGIILTIVFAPLHTESLRKKRESALRNQFRDLLDSLVTSIASGKNIQDSFIVSLTDLKMQHSEKAYIIQEVETIIQGTENSLNLEDLLIDFGIRSGIKDIVNFGVTFQTCHRKGGNIKHVLLKTHEIISNKMKMEEELQTKISSNVNEQYIMLVMPVVIVGLIKFGNETMAQNYADITGVITSIVAIIIFITAFLVGRKLAQVEI
jgi:tight adherence protein B